MFDGFTPFTIQTQSAPENVTIFGLKSSDSAASALPTLLLLHGSPQNHRIWHRVAQLLAGQYNIVAIDLRGYGDSSKPEPIAAYAKSVMARVAVLGVLLVMIVNDTIVKVTVMVVALVSLLLAVLVDMQSRHLDLSRASNTEV
ncbi:hypothetical protein NQ176_g105 [Zarea fungicola]|uniref:Uncharacterized protein n=1 Tax=Zarea fungicola TaxID=93591 RepID=A0ACC1NYU9_9HYPO|nr:hypothetical protein NQ176_g105 [Lecanicillium fungicola]